MYNLSCGAALLLLSSPIAAATFQADIVINGGSFSAPAAAMSAARTWPTAQILLIEPTDWLGGQGTSQGVSAIDNAWHEPGASLMRLNPSLYYPADYLQFLDDMSPVPGGAPGFGLSPNGTNWVSREGYDPRTAAWVLDQMVADYPNITVLKLTVVKDLNITAVNDTEGAGARITDLTLIERTPANGYIPFTDFTSVEFPDWYSTTNSARFTKQVHTVTPVNAGRGLVVIDASETSDAMVLSGARYTVGREISTEEIAANGTLPAMDEDGGNAVVFPFALKGANTTDPETAVSAQFPNFNTYYNSQLGFYGLGARTWQQVWTYRRLRTTAPLFNINTVDVNDVSMQNWNPGNDYFAGFLYTSSASAAAEAASDWRGGLNLTAMAGAELHAIGWYFWLKNNRPGSVPFSDTRLLRGNDPDNVMGTGHGLAKFPYIRGLRHGVGVRNFRITERYWDNTTASTYANTSSFRFFDSVGIGNYAADVRPVSG
ncbi:MAG: FAD-dependent oxidoreductase, partial [Candidatus Sumerlaeia bacterium]|nr:FAD-dependent oxidoreductase [Candidatus Sumerlaeia bacterium]